MESSAYPMLFSPIKVGTTEVKNRVFMPPVSTNLADHGYVTDDLVDHYRARAKGGVGLIITEVVTVEPTYTYLPGDMCCYDDTFIPGWEKLAAAVHEYGCKIMPQLFHPAYMAFNIPGTPRLIAPSFVGPSYAREAPRPITVDEIHELTHQFGDAAVRMQKAGVDGVEVHAAHAHGMLGGFLTPLYNKRTDEYGGSLDARMRFLLEVIAEIRERCGKDFIIDVRISGDEYTDGGLTLNDMIYVSRRLEKAGVVIDDARLTHLAYAPEIAQAMLRRQQADAVIAAREKIVQGAVGMVEMALAELSAKNVVDLDDERKAAMVSNLMVVLCGESDAQPVLNTGTLYQ